MFFSVTMSLDGFIAPEGRMDDPGGPRAQWMELQQWIFPQRFFRENPDAPGPIRTADLSLRRRALYPLSYGRLEPESTALSVAASAARAAAG